MKLLAGIIAIFICQLAQAETGSVSSLSYWVCQYVSDHKVIELPGKDIASQQRICVWTIHVDHVGISPENPNNYEIEVLNNDGAYVTCFADIQVNAKRTDASISWQGCFPPHPMPRIGVSN